MSKRKIAVVGAGLSGLACGRALRSAGLGVVIFEKSRSLGGRLATRNWEGQVVDHGAPWFSDVPQELSKICQDGLRCLTAPVLHHRTGKALPELAGGRWYLREGNNRIGKLLAEGLEVRLETPVEKVEPRQDGQWLLGTEDFDAVVLTAPWPQSRRLMASWAGPAQDVVEPQYRRTLTVLCEYPGAPARAAAAWSGMVHESHLSGLERTICENHKTGRVPSDRTVIVAHAGAVFSDAHFHADRATWAALLEREVREAWGFTQPSRAIFTHRWGFAAVDREVKEISGLPEGIYLAGDALSGSAAGAVYRSGLAAAQAILSNAGRSFV